MEGTKEGRAREKEEIKKGRKGGRKSKHGWEDLKLLGLAGFTLLHGETPKVPGAPGSILRETVST